MIIKNKVVEKADKVCNILSSIDMNSFESNIFNDIELKQLSDILISIVNHTSRIAEEIDHFRYKLSFTKDKKV